MMPLSLLSPTVLLLALAAAPALAAKPHEHGVARLDVVVEPGRVTLELDVPLDNLVGFERAPRTDAEREKANAALAKLRDAASMFRIEAAAGCTPGKIEIDAPTLQAPAAAGSAPPAKEGHADLEGHFEFRCKPDARAGYVEVGLFEAFPALRRIELQVVTPKGQMKASLVRPASRVILVR